MGHRIVRFGYNFVLIGMLWSQFAGCGPAAPKRNYAIVDGIVKYRGKPLSKGSVVFQPAAGASVTAQIMENGKYNLRAVIGPNTVMVLGPTVQPPAVSDDFAKNKIAQEEYDKSLKSSKTIPDKYSTPASGLKYEVKPGENLADFDLE